jgi:HK97 family phage prohead protease
VAPVKAQPAYTHKGTGVLGIDVKALTDGDAGRLAGYASKFGGVDVYGDTIAPGAFLATIPQFLRNGFIGHAHDWSDPVGMPTQAFEDDAGLWIEAEFHDTPRAQEARKVISQRLAAHKTHGLSIGYLPVKWSYIEQDGRQVRVLEQIELYEVSDVLVPADPHARVAQIKSGGAPDWMALRTHLAQALDLPEGLATRAVTLLQQEDDSTSPTRYVDEAGRVLAGLQTFAARSLDLAALRAKAGRKLGRETRSTLTTIADEAGDIAERLRTLVADSEPVSTDDDDEAKAAAQREAELRRLRVEFLAISARSLGVAV